MVGGKFVKLGRAVPGPRQQKVCALYGGDGQTGDGLFVGRQGGDQSGCGSGQVKDAQLMVLAARGEKTAVGRDGDCRDGVWVRWCQCEQGTVVVIAVDAVTHDGSTLGARPEMIIAAAVG